MPGLPIDKMLTDVRLAEEQLERLGVTEHLVADLCCHVKALADTAQRYEDGLYRIAARAENWSSEDVRANVATILGVPLADLEGN